MTDDPLPTLPRWRGREDQGAVEALLNPSSIALVGATESSLWSANLVRNLRELGYEGSVHLVNPRHEEQFGQRCHPSLTAIEEPVDHAYVMTGTPTWREVIEDCGRKRVASVTMLTSGFKETGAQGAALEQELVEACGERGITLLGPNCLGFLNYRRHICAYALYVGGPLIPGRIAILSQSGAMLIHFHRLAVNRGIGLSYLVSSGNEAMLAGADFLEHFVADPGVRVVGAYIEGITDADRFQRLADRALELDKPLVVLKIGRSDASHRVATAHTGALAGHDRVVDALFRQKGVLRVESIEELIETCAALEAGGWPRGRRVAMVTPSGGACAILADLAQDTRIELPPFAPETTAALKEILPVFGTPQNPLDTTGYVVLDATLLGRCLDAVHADPGYDALLVNFDPPREPGPNPAFVEARLERLAEAVGRSPRFSLLTATATAELTPYARELCRSFGLHFANGFPFAVRALDHAIAYGEARARFERPRAERPAIARLDLTARAGPLDEVCSREILRQIGIPVPPARVARSGQEAARLATEAGFPVVLKVIAAGLAHKSRAGGVRLDVGNASEAEAAYAEMLAAVAEREPSVSVTGVLVDRQVFPSAELIAGVSRDPQFGPVVLAGSGGVLVELLDDTVLLLPPFDADFAAEQLAGLRGRPRADLRAAADVLVRLGWAALEEPRLAELDVNPLFVLEDGSVLAGDALVVLS